MTNDTDRTARRTLQAALFEDVVGYSQLTGEDEVGTLRAVKDLINLFKESCAKHDGSLEQISGDGIFALFSSATNAVSLAIESRTQSPGSMSVLPDPSRCVWGLIWVKCCRTTPAFTATA